MLDHGRSRAVGADHVPRPEGDPPSVQSIAQRGSHAVGILLMTDVLSIESERRALLGRLLKQDRLKQWLDDIYHAARTYPQVIAPAVVPGSPRPHPDELGPGQAGGERRVSHQLPRARVSRCPSADNVRLVRRFAKRGSGSSGLEFRRPAADAASVGLRWLLA